MIREFDATGVDGTAGGDVDGSKITAESISRYISAGILFPDEILLAERMLRRLNKAA